eukprot:2148071-Amphidinium_carterae.1
MDRGVERASLPASAGSSYAFEYPIVTLPGETVRGGEILVWNHTQAKRGSEQQTINKISQETPCLWE